MCESGASCGCGGSTLPLGAMAAVVAAALAVPAAMAVLAALAPGLWAVAAVVAGLDAVAVAGLVWLVRQWRPERPVFTQAARRTVAGGVRRALPARVPLAIEAATVHESPDRQARTPLSGFEELPLRSSHGAALSAECATRGPSRSPRSGSPSPPTIAARPGVVPGVVAGERIER